MKKRRLAAGVMAAVMAAGIVAGCSSTGAGAKGSQEEKVTIKVALGLFQYRILQDHV